MKYLTTFLLSLLVLACSENKRELSQNEKNYLQTQDSVLKYKSEVLQLSGDDTSMVVDFIRMDYENYKEKYDLSEKDVDIMRRTLNVRVQEAKVFKEIQENMSRSAIGHPRSTDSTNRNYSFNKKLKPANSAKEEDVEVEVLMKAFEK
jgi:hypothetical protein